MKNIVLKFISSAALISGMALIMGCSGENTVSDQPDIMDAAIVDTSEDNDEEVEVIETSEPVEEVIEDVEEYPLPDFILYDENSEAYVPQHVTADDIYNKVAEMEETGVFTNDWERDVYVYNLLNYNVYYMDFNEAKAITNDYLSNALTTNVYESATDQLLVYKKVASKDYFIDARLSAEAEKFDNYVSNNGDMEALIDSFKLSVTDVLNNNDDSYYTSLNEFFSNILESHLDFDYLLSDEFQDYLTKSYEKTSYSDELSLPIPSGNDQMFSPDSYESSHKY